MATIKDVAKLAGVSLSTASRALSGSSLVEEETRKKVEAAAQQLSYVPNQLARGLKAGRTKTVLLVVPSLNNSFFPKQISCFESALAARGYAMLLGVADYSEQQEERCFEMARSFAADGIIYIPCSDNFAHIRSLIASVRIPVVVANRSWELETVCVTNDNVAGAYTAVKYLLGMGHTRIACFVRNVSIQHYRERMEGCLKAFREAGVPQKNVSFCYANTIRDTYEESIRLLQQPDRPTAVFVSSDWLCSGVYSAAAHCGLCVPNDISVVGFDDIESAQYMIPPLTTYHHPVDEVAQTSVGHLLALIEGQERGWGEKIILPGKLIERGSAAPLRTL